MNMCKTNSACPKQDWTGSCQKKNYCEHQTHPRYDEIIYKSFFDLLQELSVGVLCSNVSNDKALAILNNLYQEGKKK
jgi:hypothetical protein